MTLGLKTTVQKKLIDYFSENDKRYIKIGILGTHNSGKTTLGHTIMSYLKEHHVIVGWVSEIVRDCPFPVNERASFHAQLWILNSQINKEIEEQTRNNVVVTDRTVIDNFAYARRASILNKEYRKNIKVLEMICKNWVDTYDFLFFTQRTKSPIENDNFRSTDLKFQIEIDQMIRRIIRDWEIRTIELSGSNEERLDTVLDAFNKYPKLNLD